MARLHGIGSGRTVLLVIAVVVTAVLFAGSALAISSGISFGPTPDQNVSYGLTVSETGTNDIGLSCWDSEVDHFVGESYGQNVSVDSNGITCQYSMVVTVSDEEKAIESNASFSIEYLDDNNWVPISNLTLNNGMITGNTVSKMIDSEESEIWDFRLMATVPGCYVLSFTASQL